MWDTTRTFCRLSPDPFGIKFKKKKHFDNVTMRTSKVNREGIVFGQYAQSWCFL